MTKATLSQQAGVIEVQPEQWLPFLAQFTIENRGAHARLNVLGPDVGYQVEIEDRPFDGIAADVKDHPPSVWITFASTPSDHLAHGVHDVTVIRVLPPTAAKGAVVEVEAKDGVRTILELTNPDEYALAPAD
jgi:hypothetical protein